MFTRLSAWIAYKLPCEVVYFALVRAGAHATTGEYENAHPDSVSIITTMDRWWKKYRV